MKEETLYAEVVFPLPLDRSFDYAVPPSFKEKVSVGERVRAPFGRGSKIGYLVGLKAKSALPQKMIKPITELIDEVPLIDERLLSLSRQVHRYYLCSWGEVLGAMLPASLRPRKRGMAEPRETGSLPDVPFPLDEEAKNAVNTLSESLGRGKPEIILLFGGTEKEKAELILQAVQRSLEKGLSSIVLYPEIALTREAAGRFQRRFGGSVCLWHSRLSPLDRYDIWRAVREGRHRIVVGVRSAVFSPVRNLGLLVCFQEEETSYKQEEVPRYHARDVALMRSRLEGASLVLESDTPSLESYARALGKKYRLLELPSDPKKLPPKMSLIDMREELLNQKRRVLFSKYLERRMVHVLQQKGQILLFLNRRGFATFIHCQKCGTTLRCPTCNVPLKYHSQPKYLLCHYCHTKEEPPTICPVCRKSYLQYTGVGTEKVESEVHRLFPEARIGRLDADAVKEGSYEEIRETFRKKELDILIGTQMVAKEIATEGVSLVGVLSADTLLNAPDFRASERAFTLLNQLVGQARREKEPGEVVIQSFAPGHPAILASALQDYPAFYNQEIRSRKELGFPPFRFLAKILFRGKNEEKVAAVSRSFKKTLIRFKKGKKIMLLGPAPAMVRRLRGETQWQLLVKSESETLSDFLKKPLQRFKKSHAVKMTVDIDPY